jgi:DNA polymerase-3 subunit gamma/tau
VLSRVRDKKITVHAWLVDGEPVAVTEEAVLVAFKNEIHCKTTEKPANKQLIEEVISELLGRPLTLETIMQKDWKELQPQAADPSADQPAEAFQLEPENEDTQKKHNEEWINEAIELFGEDLVTIKED